MCLLWYDMDISHFELKHGFIEFCTQKNSDSPYFVIYAKDIFESPVIYSLDFISYSMPSLKFSRQIFNPREKKKNFPRFSQNSKNGVHRILHSSSSSTV